MNLVWFYLASATMVATALIHSVLGERLLISPMLAIEVPLMKQPLARQVLRYAWHLTSVFMILSAALIVWPAVPMSPIRLTGIVWFIVGIVDALLTQGKHLGWPFLAAAGILTFIGTWT